MRSVRTSRVLRDVSDLDENIVLLQLGHSNGLDRGGLALHSERFQVRVESEKSVVVKGKVGCGAWMTNGLILDEGTHLSGDFERHFGYGFWCLVCGMKGNGLNEGSLLGQVVQVLHRGPRESIYIPQVSIAKR